MNLLTIGIPTREGLYYKEFFYSLSRTILSLSTKNWGVETLICVNGPQNDLIEAEIRAIISEIPNLKARVIEQEPLLVGKPLAMRKIKEEARGELILFLDDDVEVGDSTIRDALEIFETKPNIKFVGASPKIIRPISYSHWRNFVYDVINIQQIVDVFKFPDPFIFGRFMMLRKRDVPDIPNDMLNEDMYMQILFYPNTIKIKSYVKYRGLAYLKDHFKRVSRLMEGRKQVVEYAREALVKKYFRDPSTRRILDFNKIIHLRPYLFFCFVCYRIIRALTYVAKPLFYKKIRGIGWKRTDREKSGLI